MVRQLTAGQFRTLAAFHRRAVRRQGAENHATMRILGPEEAAKLLPGIVTQYTFKVNRAPKADRS